MRMSLEGSPAIRPTRLFPWVLAVLSTMALVTLCALAARI